MIHSLKSASYGIRNESYQSHEPIKSTPCTSTKNHFYNEYVSYIYKGKQISCKKQNNELELKEEFQTHGENCVV